MEHNCRGDKGPFDPLSRAPWHEKPATKLAPQAIHDAIERILCIDENGIKLFLSFYFHNGLEGGRGIADYGSCLFKQFLNSIFVININAVSPAYNGVKQHAG